MRSAAEAVRNGKSFRKACEEYSVPRGHQCVSTRKRKGQSSRLLTNESASNVPVVIADRPTPYHQSEVEESKSSPGPNIE